MMGSLVQLQMIYIAQLLKKINSAILDCYIDWIATVTMFPRNNKRDNVSSFLYLRAYQTYCHREQALALRGNP